MVLIVSMPFIVFIVAFITIIKGIEKSSILKENGLTVGKHKIEITEDGITDTTDLGHFFHNWTAVDEVVTYQGNIYVLLDGMFAHIFPASNFSSEAERESLAQLINEKWHNHPSQATPKNGAPA